MWTALSTTGNTFFNGGGITGGGAGVYLQLTNNTINDGVLYYPKQGALNLATDFGKTQ